VSILKLRNHIPISAPARREPADGTESAMRVSLGFEPAWFHRRCGINFSENWHMNPYYRYKSLQRMKKELVKAFLQFFTGTCPGMMIVLLSLVVMVPMLFHTFLVFLSFMLLINGPI